MKTGRFAGCLLILTALSFFACKKQALLGVNQLPGKDHIQTFTTDTLTVLSKTIREDTFETIGLGQYMLGSIDNRTFGRFNAGIFMTFTAPFVPTIDPNTTSADSLVLSVPYINSGSYGDTTHSMNVNVYQLSQPMNLFYAYSNAVPVPYTSNPIGFKTAFLPRPNKFDSLSPTDTNFREPLRIRLSDHLAQAFLDQIGSTVYTSPGAFINFFNGIFLAPDLSLGYGNTVLYLDPTTALLNLYYHAGGAVGFITAGVYFNTNYAATNYYSHDYNSSQAASYVNSASSNDSLVFMQGANGVKGMIQIPNLKSLGKILVNRAELEVTLRGDTLYSPPSSMIIFRDSAGLDVNVRDFTDAANSRTSVPFGGTRVYETEPTTGSARYIRYRFTLTEYLQDLVNDEAYTQSDSGLFLSVGSPAQNVSQIVVGGANRNDIYKMKLNLTYTKVQ
jgi:hypothetical protein